MRHARARELQQVALVEPLALDLRAAFLCTAQSADGGAMIRQSVWQKTATPSVGVRRRMSSTASRKNLRYSSGASETSEISGIPVTTEPGNGRSALASTPSRPR